MFRALCVVLSVLLAAGAAAQPYPSKPVRIVIPASPGGASDLVGRLVATQLSEMLGQPFVVENRVTSGGIVGTQQVAESPPDGHTLLVTFDTFASNALLFKNLKWDPVRDFAPVMQLCRYPQVLLVHPSLGVRTVREFVDLAKQRGPQLNYASAGPASSSRLAYELFKDVAGIETVQILRYAGRALELAARRGHALEDGFLARLEQARSNHKEFGTGRDIFAREVAPRMNRGADPPWWGALAG